MELQTFPADAPFAEIAAALDAAGCVVITKPLPNHVIRQVVADLERFEKRSDFGEGVFVGSRTKRLGGIIRKSGASVRMLGHELILELMDHALGPYCERVRMNLSEAITIYPGQKNQFLHRDDEMFHAHAHGFKGEAMANVMWALTDFTETNGATRVVPGSHKWERSRQADPDEIVLATMRAGDCLIYLGSVVHSGGENISEAPRRGLIFSYALGWLRQRESQYLVCPPEVARFLPDHIQDLIGYSVHRPNLGLYECEDPKDLLRPRKSHRLGSRDFLTPELQELAERLAS